MSIPETLAREAGKWAAAFRRDLAPGAKKVYESARANPVFAVVSLLVVFAVIFLMLDRFEMWPEGNREPARRETEVIRSGQNLIWLGMEVTPLSRSVRKEFGIPSSVKGMFVSDNGRGRAAAYGVEAFDVIVSVNGKASPGSRKFASAAGNAKFYDGILLDVYRNKKRHFVSIPYDYKYGPVIGPNQGHWQLGAPLWGQIFPYGRSENTQTTAGG
ncbi:MAG: PDZ domain-containing protein [Candidatus Omnitrophica bacterium]|nr:PDZ domain-containing protein [Candidatus Omnitrophota bacterium]